MKNICAPGFVNSRTFRSVSDSKCVQKLPVGKTRYVECCLVTAYRAKDGKRRMKLSRVLDEYRGLVIPGGNYKPSTVVAILRGLGL